MLSLVSAKDCTWEREQGPFSLVELKCENMVDPLGIDNVTPCFSWKLKGDGAVDRQAFYEIQVASDSLLLIGGRRTYGNRES